jgi:hypothetical protein
MPTPAGRLGMRTESQEVTGRKAVERGVTVPGGASPGLLLAR